MNKEELILRIQDLEDLNLQQEARLQEVPSRVFIWHRLQQSNSYRKH